MSLLHMSTVLVNFLSPWPWDQVSAGDLRLHISTTSDAKKDLFAYVWTSFKKESSREDYLHLGNYLIFGCSQLSSTANTAIYNQYFD